MLNNTGEYIVVVLMILSMLLGVGLVGEDLMDVKQQAIEQGCAQYSPTTGEFEWGNKP